MINWDIFINDLKNIKSKYVLIFKFFNLLKFFDDKNASKILSLLINNYLDIFIKYSFYEISKYIPIKRYTKTQTILITFYELMKEKTQLIMSLSKWNLAYKNKIYWIKDNKYQIEHLVNLNLHIKALFDSVISNQSFVMKIIPIIKANINNSKYVVFENVIQRLIKLHNLLGSDFFTTYNIKTMTVDDFYNLNDDEKMMYISSIQTETLIILEHTIENYDKFNMINLKIDNLLNPFSIHIENDTCTEYDVEDIKDFI